MITESKKTRSGVPISETIVASWKRCEAAGLKESDRIDCLPFSDDALRTAREENSKLLTYAGPAVENVYEQVAGTGSAVVVANRGGVILCCQGDPDFLDAARRVALQPGECWAEEYVGTNAIGTSLVELLSVCVRGNEHFLARNRFFCGCASPIFDPRGDLVGVLGIFSASGSGQQHTLGLVKMSSVLVENRMLVRELPNAIVVYFHPSLEYIGTIKHCIAVFARDGRLLGTNRAARQIWDWSAAQVDEYTFASFFDFPFQRLADQARVKGHTPFPGSLRDGRQVFLSVDLGLVETAAEPLAGIQVARPVEKTGRSLKAPDITLRDLDGGDSAIQHAIQKASMILGCDIPLLIEGESGVGKELFTRAFHNTGPRHQGPFIAVNCAAIPEGLIESELFGYDEGAFTGAKRKGYAGKIYQANHGTLFLDEIGDMPPALQGRLLRVLQERQVTPLGSSKSIPVDIFIVCATHRKLRDEVAEGRFRADLYYRLNGLRVILPPLRQRGDLEQLVRLIARSERGEKEIEITPEVMEAFRRFSWPGNLRQLQMVLRTAVALLGRGNLITLCHLPDEFAEESAERSLGLAVPASTPGSPVTGDLARMELTVIKQAMDATAGNISAAARQLGISRKTLYRKLGRT